MQKGKGFNSTLPTTCNLSVVKGIIICMFQSDFTVCVQQRQCMWTPNATSVPPGTVRPHFPKSLAGKCRFVTNSGQWIMVGVIQITFGQSPWNLSANPPYSLSSSDDELQGLWWGPQGLREWKNLVSEWRWQAQTPTAHTHWMWCKQGINDQQDRERMKMPVSLIPLLSPPPPPIKVNWQGMFD